MANTGVSHEEVKSICNKLECSPSQNDATSNYGGQAKLRTQKAGSQYAAGSEKTSELKMKAMKHGKIPGYGSKMAKKADKY